MNRLWRSWLRNESPRRAVIGWSQADKAVLLIACLAVAFLSSWYWLQVPDANFEVGMPSPADIRAPRAEEVPYRDEEQEKGAELIQGTMFVQVIDPEESEILKEVLQKKLDKISLLASNNNEDRVPPVNLTEQEQNWLQETSKEERYIWELEVQSAASRMLRQGLINTISFDELSAASSLQLAQIGDISSPARTLATKLLSRSFHRRTNLRQDSSLQGFLEDTINLTSPPIKVKEGDYITREGETISKQEHYLLNYFGLLPRSPKLTPFSIAFAESLIGCWVLLLIMRREKPCLRARHGFLALGLILIAQVSKTLFGNAITPLALLVPPTLLLSQGLGSTCALAWLAVQSLLFQIPINGINGIIYEVDEARLMIACAVSAVIAIQSRGMRSRAQLLQMAFLLPFGTLLFEWFFLRGTEAPNSSDDLVYEALILASVLMLAILLIPILENTFGLITKARLMELADQERPLLRRLSAEAPGTFEHTMMICSLAEEGGRSIGADVDLIRTGALYHDVGKLHAPNWFIENQTSELNPHDELNDPQGSAKVLQAHVDEGLKLAKKHRLPEPIADFIPEHQGTLKMGYFLHKAKEKNPDIEEKAFRYRGPIPRSRETAILMLADGCEAALRSLDPKTIDAEACLTVKSIFKSRQNDGQLKESSLTRAELELISRAFVSVWRRMRHRRIPYPISSSTKSY